MKRIIAVKYLQLLLACLVVGVVWCLVLPQVASFSYTKSRLELLDKYRVDPSAMYYTELEAMQAILNRLETKNSNMPYSSEIEIATCSDCT